MDKTIISLIFVISLITIGSALPNQAENKIDFDYTRYGNIYYNNTYQNNTYINQTSDINKTYANATYVPYTGATTDVNLGANDLLADDVTTYGKIFVNQNPSYLSNIDMYDGGGGMSFNITHPTGSYRFYTNKATLSATIQSTSINANRLLWSNTGFDNVNSGILTIYDGSDGSMIFNRKLRSGGMFRWQSNGTDMMVLGNNGTLIINANNESNIALWVNTNISATGYITRTNVYDTGLGPALDKIKPASDYLTASKEIDHPAFDYSYVRYKVPVEIRVNDTYSYESYRIEEGVDLVREMALLKEAVYELKKDNENIKNCITKSKTFDNAKLCIGGIVVTP